VTATNHALTGAAIGLLTGNPWLAIPAAVASHFVLDALPHFGLEGDIPKFLRSRGFTVMLASDAILCVLLVAVLALLRPEHWLLASFCAFMATSPDLLWINQYLKARRHLLWKPGLIARFSIWSQWFQRPIGAFVELAWFAGIVSILATYIINQ
jgi:hypothetical protein